MTSNTDENETWPPTAYYAMRAVLEYENKYRRQGLDALKVSKLYDLRPDGENPVSPCWPDEYPNSGCAGVYMFFDEQLNLLYVGKASMNNCLGNRIGAYFQYAEDKKSCQMIHDWKPASPKFVATIAVPEDMPFEAPALEEYLIRLLNPPGNTVGKSR